MSIRSNLIHLAHSNPELRPHLLPLLKQGAGQYDDVVLRQFPVGTVVKIRDPGMTDLKRTIGGEPCTVVDRQTRFTPFGNNPFIVHVLVEDTEGHQAWLDPWKLGFADKRPGYRTDINVIISQVVKAVKRFDPQRGFNPTKSHRSLYFLKPYPSREDIMEALRKVPRFQGGSKPQITFPGSKGDDIYSVNLDLFEGTEVVTEISIERM